MGPLGATEGHYWQFGPLGHQGPLGATGATRSHWGQWDLLGATWGHMEPLGAHVGPLCATRRHRPRATRSHWGHRDPLGATGSHLEPLGATWGHYGPLGVTPHTRPRRLQTEIPRASTCTRKSCTTPPQTNTRTPPEHLQANACAPPKHLKTKIRGLPKHLKATRPRAAQTLAHKVAVSWTRAPCNAMQRRWRRSCGSSGQNAVRHSRALILY